jgi:hypothetical protein
LVIAPEIPELQITDVVAGLGANDFLFVESAQATGLLSSIAAINTWPMEASIENVGTRPTQSGTRVNGRS